MTTTELRGGRVARSYLFVPGARPDRFDKALAAGADRVILDLEDAVPPDGKEAARAAGRAPPVDGVTPSFDDGAVLARDANRARLLGFGGKLCIHPRQVAAVNAAFRPTAEEIAWARRVVEADARVQGAAVAVDGKMVDRPVLLKAHAILAEAE